jgi:hypothetical protein
MNAVAASEAKTIVVVGDSHAEQWMAALEPVAAQRGERVVSLLKGGCVYAPTTKSGNPDCDAFNASVAAYLAANPPGTVFMVGTVAAASSPAEVLSPGLDAVVAALTAKGSTVVALRDNPRFTFNMADCVARNGASSPKCSLPQSSLLAPKNPLTAFAAAHPKHFVQIDMTDLLCPRGACPGVIGNTYVYLDDNHVTRTYSASMATILGQRLSAAGLS